MLLRRSTQRNNSGVGPFFYLVKTARLVEMYVQQKMCILYFSRTFVLNAIRSNKQVQNLGGVSIVTRVLAFI
jgi:hypothetical protein